MILLFTVSRLARSLYGSDEGGAAPNIHVIDLFADAPVGNVKASAYLLAVYAVWFPAGTVLRCVVDPGVGGPRPSVLEADGPWYFGVGNGLFAAPCRRGAQVGHRMETAAPVGQVSRVRSLPPVAAMLARGEQPAAGHVGVRRVAGRSGRTTFAKSSTSIISAMP
jgi:S-adenosylmethionine hydroxide adenosyltransferase-like protein